MSFARLVSKIVLGGSVAVGRAFAEAGRQAVKNAKHRPEAVSASSNDKTATGTTGTINASLKMTLEEANLILNVKPEDPMEIIQKHYETIFAANAPPEAPKPDPTKPAPPPPRTRAERQRLKQSAPPYSHYLQSKVFRALERIKAERAEPEPEPEPEVSTEGEAAAAPAPAPGAETPKAGDKPEAR